MVAPVSGPFSRTDYVNGPPTSLGYKPIWLYRTKTWSRQRKPYNLPLGYSMTQKRVVKWDSSSSSSYCDYTQVHYGFRQSMIDAVHNECYARLVRKLKEEHSSSELDARGHPLVTTTGSSGLGTTLAEINQAKAMITTRVETLLKFTKAVRGYRFYDAFHILGMHKKIADRNAWLKQTRVRRGSRYFANNWLEFHFGWVPLIDDIQQAIEVLTGGLPDVKIRARAKRFEWKDTNFFAPTPAYISKFETERWTYSQEMGLNVEVLNPNMWLANRLGVINPLALAWEVTPWSFVLDWVVNLNDVIASFTDFYGLKVSNQYTSSLAQLTYSSSSFKPSVSFREIFVTEYVGMGRATTITGPVLSVRPAKALSWVRGLTASSLLLQLLKKP